MKKILLGILGVLLLSGCTNKEMVSYYENTKAGGKIDSYQLDLRIYGSFGDETYNEIFRVDNYKGTQFKVDNIGKNIVLPKEEPTEKEVQDDLLPIMRDNSSYKIDGKSYELKDNTYVEVETLMYTNPNIYLETITKAKKVEELKEDKIGDNTYKTYSFKVDKKDMEPILKDGALKDLKLKSDVSAKLWIDKDSRVYKVIYYLIEGKDRVEINASFFRINVINDMSNIVR